MLQTALASIDPVAFDAADTTGHAALVDELGFDPLPTGDLASGRSFQAHTPAFGYPLTLDALAAAVARA